MRPGGGGQFDKAPAALLPSETQARENSPGQRQVGCVEAPVEAAGQSKARFAFVEFQAQTSGNRAGLAHRQVSSIHSLARHAQHSAGKFVRQVGAEGVVDVDYGGLGTIFEEQPLLCPPVGGRITVVVKMIAAQLRERGQSNTQADDTLLVQTLGGNLQKHMFNALVRQNPQAALQFVRVGCSHRTGPQLWWAPPAQGAHGCGGPAERIQGLCGKPGNGGFSVGARYAGYGQALRWPSVVGVGKQPHLVPQFRNRKLANVLGKRRRNHAFGRFPGDRHRATLQGLRQEIQAVASARARKEQALRDHAIAVHGQPPYPHFGVRNAKVLKNRSHIRQIARAVGAHLKATKAPLDSSAPSMGAPSRRSAPGGDP